MKDINTYILLAIFMGLLYFVWLELPTAIDKEITYQEKRYAPKNH